MRMRRQDFGSKSTRLDLDKKTRSWILSSQLHEEEKTGRRDTGSSQVDLIWTRRQDPGSCQVNFMRKKRWVDEILDLVK